MKIVTQTEISAYPLLSRGKVRDIYDIDEKTLLIVTTDRMSAFDVIMDEPVPYKGVILNQITRFWMDRFTDIIPNHIIEHDVHRFPEPLAPWREELEGRSMLVHKTTPLPIECIVRGYLSGSGWKDYQETSTICGHPLPGDLQESSKLEQAIFTPSTKAELGEHDMNISRERTAEILGSNIAMEAEKASLAIYEAGRTYAAARGIIVADTKFEFGFVNNKLTLIDEVLTPDSSRFWPADLYAPGRAQPSFDKQYLRDWLKKQDWNMQPPAPKLPQDVIDATAKRYRDAYTILTGKTLPI